MVARVVMSTLGAMVVADVVPEVGVACSADSLQGIYGFGCGILHVRGL